MDPNDYAFLGDESRYNITGRGTSVFNMKGRYVIVRNAPHVPSVWSPIYSTQRHRNQPG